MNDGNSESEDSDLTAFPARNHLVTHVVSFVRDFRRAGAEVPANAGIDAAEALAIVGIDDRHRTRAALRTTLVSRREDLKIFDRLFPPFWDALKRPFDPRGDEIDRARGRSEATPASAGERPTQSDENRDGRSADSDPPTDGTDASESTANQGLENGSSRPMTERSGKRRSDGHDEIESGSVPPSTSDTVRHRTAIGDRVDGGTDADDTGRMTASTYSQAGSPTPIEEVDVADADKVDEAVREMRRSIATQQRSRWKQNSGGGRVDMRRALRRSVGTGGAITEIPRRTRRTTGVRCVLLVDVSRSVLDTIDRRFLIRFLRSVTDAWRTVQIFFFDTSVRDVTERFETASAADAVRALRRAETEWGGGTRIGHAIESIRRSSPHAVDRSTTVFLISDGLEVGEIELLEEGVAWLARRSNALLWLNPLAASPAYEPTAEGMAVSLPYLDGLFAFTKIEDVVEMGRQLRVLGSGTSVGYQHDQRTRGG